MPESSIKSFKLVKLNVTDYKFIFFQHIKIIFIDIMNFCGLLDILYFCRAWVFRIGDTGPLFY